MAKDDEKQQRKFYEVAHVTENYCWGHSEDRAPEDTFLWQLTRCKWVPIGRGVELHFPDGWVHDIWESFSARTNIVQALEEMGARPCGCGKRCIAAWTKKREEMMQLFGKFFRVALGIGVFSEAKAAEARAAAGAEARAAAAEARVAAAEARIEAALVAAGGTVKAITARTSAAEARASAAEARAEAALAKVEAALAAAGATVKAATARDEAANTEVKAAETRAEAAEARAKAVEAKARAAEVRLEAAEARAKAAEARAEAAEAKVKAALAVAEVDEVGVEVTPAAPTS